MSTASFGTPDSLQLGGARQHHEEVSVVGVPAAITMGTVSVDLVRASYRSDDFPQDWSQQQREAACARYQKWLRLKRGHANSPLAPTRDIDRFWHLHMLSPVAYSRDCMALFGKLLDHDGGFGKEEGERPELQRVFEQTARWWELEYGEPYLDDGRWLKDAVITDCWHDCSGRCWHACSSKDDE